MQVIRCPQCKYDNDVKPGGASGCALCGEDMMRCNYCRHLVAGDGCGKVEGADYYMPNGNGAKNCPYYSSIYQRRGIRFLQFIPAPLWVIASIFLAFMLVIVTAFWVDPDMRYFYGNDISVDVKLLDNYTEGYEKAMYLRISNPLQIKSTDITVQVEVQMFGDFMPGVVLGRPDIINIPGAMPSKIQADETRLIITLNPLDPGSEYNIKIPLHSLTTGEKSLHLQIFAPRGKKVKDVDIIPG